MLFRVTDVVPTHSILEWAAAPEPTDIVSPTTGSYLIKFPKPGDPFLELVPPQGLFEKYPFRARQ